jgi:hypothetical protein
MGYYAAGGYYQAGGFSFKKLFRAVGKAATFVQSQPILSGIVGLVPGGSSVLAGAGVVSGMAHSASASAAVSSSTAGTPGMNAAMAVGGGRSRRKRKPRSHGKYGYW